MFTAATDDDAEARGDDAELVVSVTVFCDACGKTRILRGPACRLFTVHEVGMIGIKFQI